MTVPVDPHNFVNGATADADQVDARFLPLYSVLAGGLTDDNIANDGISLGKLKPYVAALRHSAPTQLMASDITTFNKIQMNTVVVDERPSGESAQADDAGDQLVCREAGIYIVMGVLPWTADIDGSRRAVIRHNGSTRFEVASQGSFDAHTSLSVLGILSLADGDTIALYGAHSAGGNLGPTVLGYGPFIGFARLA